MAHNVALVELNEADAFHAPKHIDRIHEAAAASRSGRSICVVSPVTTILELKPAGEDHLHLLGVLFCASSRMMKLSFNVRPRMKAMGAIR